MPIPIALVLGSGMGAVFSSWQAKEELPFGSIPDLGGASVEGHEGVVRICDRMGRTVVVLSGRPHYYEGRGESFHALVRFLASRGVGEMVLTSASGSLDKRILPGEFVIAEGVIDLQFRSPLAPRMGSGHRRREQRSDGMSHREVLAERPALSGRSSLDPSLTSRLWDACRRTGIHVHRGIVAVASGPNYETPAEVRALRRMGASVVTMSAAPELAAAARAGIRVAALAVVTNLACFVPSTPLSHGDVCEAASGVAKRLEEVLGQFIDME